MEVHALYVQEQRASLADADTALAQEAVDTTRRSREKTADPGFIVHWTFPPGLSKESKWLAYYVSLSRPRSFSKLLSHGLPEREIIEAGPPEDIVKAFKELFTGKIARTKLLV